MTPATLTNISRNQATWWVTIHEICNSKRVLNFPIHKSVTSIFYKNPTLIHLYDKQNNPIETPTIVFFGNYHKLLPIVAVFGQRNLQRAPQGPNFYFGTYNSAVRYAAWTPLYKTHTHHILKIAREDGRFEQGGIVRFALFLGKFNTRLNHPNDPILTEPTFKCPKYHKKWNKIYDYRGLWTKKYDSICVGRTKSSNGYVHHSNPVFTTKSFARQCPLTMHLLDMSTLKSAWDPCYTKYYIK